MGESYCKSCDKNINGSCALGAEESCTQKQKAAFLNRVENIIAVMSGKGGVGKSSLTALLAAGLAKRKYRVGILDADITGPSIPKMFGLKDGRLGVSEAGMLPVFSRGGIKIVSMSFLLERESDPVIWRGPLIAGAVKQFWEEVVWGELDYLLVDLPPGTGDVPLTVMQSIPLGGIIVVTSPQELVRTIVKKAIKMARVLKVPVLGLIENMSYVICPHCGEKIDVFGKPQGEQVAAESKIEFLGKMPIDVVFTEMADKGMVEEYLEQKEEVFVSPIINLFLEKTRKETSKKTADSR